jgi:hypothetical protein
VLADLMPAVDSMKLANPLLMAMAGVSLLAAATGSAAEQNLAGVTRHAADEQVTSINQFSDVRPTDWA